ncbi:GLPGLI family protein [Parapedobacter luteus]|uniref:GLPGLI family protein n=2 Tax=Parapedobacter luteus TaxID=623280 RepID=A0A1T5FFK5_9SPHI|nr:GLPGLI family protein [Parapedobacter luteus]
MYHIKKFALLFLILPILFNSSCLFGQESQSNQGKAIYLVSLNYSIPRVYDGELIFDEKSSIFTYDKDTYEGEARAYDEVHNVRAISKGRSTDDIGLVIYSDFMNNKTVERDFIQDRPFIVSDTLRTIDWTLLNETKEIGDIKCQKATATVYGREYEVWFSNTIPLPYGPWKLQGLPGLILEARSTDGEINFELKEIHPALNDRYEILPPSKGETILGYINFYELQNKKADEFLKATQAKIAEFQQSQGTGSTAMTAIKSSVHRIEKTSKF